MSEEGKRYVVDESIENEAKNIAVIMGSAICRALPKEAETVRALGRDLNPNDVSRMFDQTVAELIAQRPRSAREMMIHSRAGSYIRHAARKLIENIAEDGTLIVPAEEIMKEDIEVKVLEDNPPEETMEEIEKMMEEDSEKNDKTMRDLGLDPEEDDETKNEGDGDDGSCEIHGSEEDGEPESGEPMGGNNNEQGTDSES